MEDQIENFIGKLITFGGGSLIVTIPKRHVDFSNLKEGDFIKIWYKKVKKESEPNEKKGKPKKE